VIAGHKGPLKGVDIRLPDQFRHRACEVTLLRMERQTTHTTTDKWIEFLTPEVLRNRLISASIYLAAFELLKDSIIDHPRSFFTSGFDINGPIVGPQYEEEILTRNGSPLYASLSWLQEFGVLDDNDLAVFENLKNVRNTVAHEMHQLASGGAPSKHVAELPKLVALLRKIEIWWIVNVEIPTNPDFDDATDVDEDGILPGPVMAVSLMVDVALGSEEEANRYVRAFREERERRENGGQRPSKDQK
jgi:hypothetical protein